MEKKEKEIKLEAKEWTLEDKPRILILEDNPMRIDLFRRFVGGKARFQIFETAWPAIKALQTFKYDLIFLDHDLGGQQMVTDDKINGTGYDVAKALANTLNKDTQVVVHSCNPVGAKNMMAVLNDKTHAIPFGADIFKWFKIN